MCPKISEDIYFRAFIEKNLDGIVVVDKQGMVLFANLAAAKLFDRKRKELCGKKFGFPLAGDKVVEINIPGKNKEMGIAQMWQTPIEWEGKRAGSCKVCECQ